MKAQFTGYKLACSFFVCLAALLLSAAVSVAQSSGTAALTGAVTDLSGASLANVTVTATNLGTNQQRTMTTGPDGIYKFALLPPGNYRVQFSAKGFKTTEVPAVTIEVTETATVDRVLEVGTVTESVTVQAAAEALQTESSTLGGTVTGRSITNLPTASRNYTEILGLSAGTSGAPENAASFGKGTQDLSVNGSGPVENNFQMDGVSINSTAGFSANDISGIYPGVAVPSPDAIEEFKVQTSNFDASYGRNSGANVNVVTKSGTNQVHGTAFEFLRNSVLNADDYFYPKSSPGEPARQTLNQNQFGGTIGGPIRKNKLFYFLSYQGTRSKNGEDPSIAEAYGINMLPIPSGTRSTDKTSTWAQSLAALNCPANNTGPYQHDYSALTGGPALLCDGSNLNQVALNLLNVKGPASSGGYYIPANDSPGCSPNGNILGYYTCNFTDTVVRNEDQGSGNLDYMINSKNTFAVRFFQSLATEPTYGDELPGYVNSGEYTNTNGLLRLTTVVTNNFVNEARASYQRLYSHAGDSLPAGDDPTDLGMTTIEPAGSPAGSLPPAMIMVQANTILNGFIFPVWTAENQFEYADQISWSHRSQTIRAGAEFEKDQWNFIHDGIERSLVVIGNWNDLLVGQKGNILSCALCVKAIPQGLLHWYRLPATSAFVQDDWKVRPRLTLNLGVRWELGGEVSDAGGNATNIWPSLLATVANSQMPFNLTACGGAMCSTSLVGNVVAKNSIGRYGQPPTGVLVASTNSPLLSHAPYSNFAPRMGFSWQPWSSLKLLVRGGGGIFYDRVGIESVVPAMEQGNPYSATLNYAFPNSGTLQDLFPAAASTPMPGYQGRYFDAACVTFGFCNYATGTFFPGSPGSSGLSTPMLNDKIHTPLVRQYSLGLQYEFKSGWVLDLGYAGSSGINLLDTDQNLNTAQLIPAGDSITLNGSGGAVSVTTNTKANAAARVPFVGYQPTGVEQTSFNGISNFNSLQADVKHQFGHGLTMQAAYTWSKTLTDLYNGSANGNIAADLGQQYGPASFNHTNRFIVNYNYDLPFGKEATGIEGKLISGWNVSGVSIFQSGDPIQIIDERLGAGYGLSSSSSMGVGWTRPNLCPGMTVADVVAKGSVRSKLNSYFNKNAFQRYDQSNILTCPLPQVPNSGGDSTATDVGNLPPMAVTGPGENNWDISLMKATKLREGLTMQFRTEFYNAFNHAQFSDPVTGNGSSGYFANVDTETFGQITTSSVNPRLIQFAARFVF
jgi:hypothetical protein